MIKKEIYERLRLLSVNIAWVATLFKTWGEHYRDEKMRNEGHLMESVAKTTRAVIRQQLR